MGPLSFGPTDAHETRCWLRWTPMIPEAIWSPSPSIHSQEAAWFAWAAELGEPKCQQHGGAARRQFPNPMLAPTIGFSIRNRPSTSINIINIRSWNVLIFLAASFVRKCRRIHCVGVDHFGALFRVVVWLFADVVLALCHFPSLLGRLSVLQRSVLVLLPPSCRLSPELSDAFGMIIQVGD